MKTTSKLITLTAAAVATLALFGAAARPAQALEPDPPILTGPTQAASDWPDLAISGIGTGTVRISNLTRSPAGFFWVKIERSQFCGQSAGMYWMSVSGLAGHSSVTLNFGSGVPIRRVIADSTRAVHERNEFNNEASTC